MLTAFIHCLRNKKKVLFKVIAAKEQVNAVLHMHIIHLASK